MSKWSPVWLFLKLLAAGAVSGAAIGITKVILSCKAVEKPDAVETPDAPKVPDASEVSEDD